MNRYHLNLAIYLDCLNKNDISHGLFKVANRSFRTSCPEHALVTNIFVPNIQRLAIFAFDERLRKSVENELHLVCVYFTKKVSKLSKCRISAPFESNRPWPKSSLESCFWCSSFIWSFTMYIFTDRYAYFVVCSHVRLNVEINSFGTSRQEPWYPFIHLIRRRTFDKFWKNAKICVA